MPVINKSIELSSSGINLQSATKLQYSQLGTVNKVGHQNMSEGGRRWNCQRVPPPRNIELTSNRRKANIATYHRQQYAMGKNVKNRILWQLDPLNLYMASSSNKQTIVDVYLNHVIIDGALELAVEKSYLKEC
jgi:hypothetical protein